MKAQRGTALYHAKAGVPVVSPNRTVGQVLKHLRSRQWESARHVFVVDSEKNREFQGVASIRRILAAKNGDRIGEIARKDFPAVGPDTPEREVAIMAIRRDLDAIPVTDPETGRFMGTVDAEDLLKILHESHAEQMLKRAGVLKDGKVVNIFRARVAGIIRLRLPWLLVGFMGGILITFVISQFETVLKEAVALAFFIPILAYMNAAVGTQAVSIFVRGMSIEDFSIRRYAYRELAVGGLLGLFFGLLIFSFAYLAFGSLPVALTIGLSMLLGIFLSTVNGMAVPYILKRLGKDPAFGSDPTVTIIQDFLSILIYLLLASVLVLR